MDKNKSVNLALVGLDLVDEFEGEEIESKLEFSPSRPKELISLVKKKLEIIRNPIFGLLPQKKEILSWVYFFDRYGYTENGNIKEAYSTIFHPQKDKFWIKAKEQSESKGILIRKESIIRVERKLTKNDAELILKLKSEELGREILFIGRVNRYKSYLLVQNKKSFRCYSVSADLCRYRKNVLSQLEIEYKGIRKEKATKPFSSSQINLIKDEINSLSALIKDELEPKFKFWNTNKTKFEWLYGCVNR